MIELKSFLIEKELPFQELGDILEVFLEDNSISNFFRNIIFSEIPSERLAAELQNYLELCKESLISDLIERTQEAISTIEMVEILSCILPGLHLIIQRKNENLILNNVSHNYFSMI